jgi:cytoskeleton protein RodZ
MSPGNREPNSAGPDHAPAATTGSGEGKSSVLGEQLRQARNAKGLSLAEAAAATRIHAATLEALENNNSQALPAPVFSRGFVRIYAAYLGLDPEEALRLHIQEQKLPTAATTEKIHIDEVLTAQSMAAPPRRLTGNHVFILLVLVVALFLAYWAYSNYLRPQAPGPLLPLPNPPGEAVPESPPPPPATEQPALDANPAAGEETGDTPETGPAPEPAAEPASSAATGPAAAAASSVNIPDRSAAPTPVHVLVAHFVEETWGRVNLDDAPPREISLLPGDARTWKAGRQIALRIGNAGGASLFYNGEPLPPLGFSGEIVDLRFP